MGPRKQLPKAGSAMPKQRPGPAASFHGRGKAHLSLFISVTFSEPSSQKSSRRAKQQAAPQRLAPPRSTAKLHVSPGLASHTRCFLTSLSREQRPRDAETAPCRPVTPLFDSSRKVCRGTQAAPKGWPGSAMSKQRRRPAASFHGRGKPHPSPCCNDPLEKSVGACMQLGGGAGSTWAWEAAPVAL